MSVYEVAHTHMHEYEIEGQYPKQILYYMLSNDGFYIYLISLS